MEKAANVMRIIAFVGAIMAICFIIYYYVYICIIYPRQLLRRHQRKLHVTDTNVEDESKYEDLDGYDIETNYSDQGEEVFVKRVYKCMYNSICV
jgi:hypothetical protein